MNGKKIALIALPAIDMNDTCPLVRQTSVIAIRSFASKALNPSTVETAYYFWAISGKNMALFSPSNVDKTLYVHSAELLPA